MGEKRGDQQSRAELLGLLLKAAGFDAYMVRHGSGRNQRHLVVLRLDETETRALSEAVGTTLSPIVVGPAKVIPLPLDANAALGQVGDSMYNAEQGRWTSSVAISRVQ